MLLMAVMQLEYRSAVPMNIKLLGHLTALVLFMSPIGEEYHISSSTISTRTLNHNSTAGWIIYTWNQSLIDGTAFRLPRMKITANDGTDMERNPRPVDVEVTRPIGETYTGKDSQLDAAVRE
jgi:hypothetical protein